MLLQQYPCKIMLQGVFSSDQTIILFQVMFMVAARLIRVNVATVDDLYPAQCMSQ